MAERSASEWNSSIISESEEPDTIRLVLLQNMKLIITGSYTGKTYIFDGAGSIQDVDKLDAEEFLKRRSPKECCPGSVGGNRPYFEISEV